MPSPYLNHQFCKQIKISPRLTFVIMISLWSSKFNYDMNNKVVRGVASNLMITNLSPDSWSQNMIRKIELVGMNLIKIWIHVTVMRVQGNHVHLTCFKRPCLGQAIFPMQQHGPSVWVLVWFHLEASPGKIIYI